MELLGDDLSLGDKIDTQKPDAATSSSVNEMRSALDNIAETFRVSSHILVSTLNRALISREIYRVQRLDLFQERSSVVSRSGVFGQTMRFIVYVVYSIDNDAYMLRVDDALSGTVTYLELETEKRIFSQERIVDFENQIISGLAGILLGSDGDWKTIWGGYKEKIVVLAPDYDTAIFGSIREFMSLIEACPDNKKLSRVDLHLAHFIYDRVRFTILNGEIGNMSFKRESPIYIPEKNTVPYDSSLAESLLETFVDYTLIEEMTKDRAANSRIGQYEAALVNELDAMITTLRDTDVKSVDWIQKKIELRNEAGFDDVEEEEEEEDDGDDVFYDISQKHPTSDASQAPEPETGNFAFSVMTDSDVENDVAWSEMTET